MIPFEQSKAQKNLQYSPYTLTYFWPPLIIGGGILNTSQFQTDTSDGSSGLVAAFLCNKGLYAAMLSHHNLFRTMSKNRPTNAMVEF